MSDLRYPAGPFRVELVAGEVHRRKLLLQMAETPARLRAAVKGLGADQFDTPYRPGGWTVRQVVHHVVDCHVNWYVRTKLALTEDGPTIKPYAEGRWAELFDARLAPAEMSLALLEGLHERWVALLAGLAPEQWSRTLFHPERGVLTLDSTLPMHVWHGRHHTGHITGLRERMGWN